MSDTKKYYWIKLQKDFFKRTDIQLIERMDNGKDYIMFYLKLLLESIEKRGELRVTDTVPYDDRMLSHLTGVNIDVVRSAMKIFSEFGMIKILDNETIFMIEVEKMTGHETEWARKKQKQREKKRISSKKQKAIGHQEDNVPEVSGQCPIRDREELDKDKDIDIDIELKLNKEIEIEEEKKTPTLPSTSKTSKTIIEYLNNKAGKNYSNTKVYHGMIQERLDGGATIEDFKYVIDLKCLQWLGREGKENDLNPIHLFSETKFDMYRNEKTYTSNNSVVEGEYYDWQEVD